MSALSDSEPLSHPSMVRESKRGKPLLIDWIFRLILDTHTSFVYPDRDFKRPGLVDDVQDFPLRFGLWRIEISISDSYSLPAIQRHRFFAHADIRVGYMLDPIEPLIGTSIHWFIREMFNRNNPVPGRRMKGHEHVGIGDIWAICAAKNLPTRWTLNTPSSTIDQRFP